MYKKMYFLYNENVILDTGFLFKSGYDMFCADFLHIPSLILDRLFILILLSFNKLWDYWFIIM